MAGAVTVTRDDVKKVLASMQAVASKRVLVGVPSTTAGRKEEELSNATIGYLMEHGVPERNVPPRPFLIPGVKGAQKEISRRLRDIARLGLSTQPGRVVYAMNALGLFAQSAVRAKITDGPFVPLSPRTIEGRLRRRRAGRQLIAQRGVSGAIIANRSMEVQIAGEKPLIDTGQLRQSINYVIR